MAGGGDTQIGNQERAKILNELNQISAWKESIKSHAQDLTTELSGDVAKKYSSDYDYGESICTDITNFIQDINDLCSEIASLIARTSRYVERHAETNAAK